MDDESKLDQIATGDLIEFVNGSDDETRAAAIYALRTRSTADAVTALITVLANPDTFLARTACDSLIHIGKVATSNLIEALKDQNIQTRGLAARALAHIKDQSSIPALFNALDDESMMVQYWADEALEKMGVGQIYFKP
ncbi:MAG: HEAT repeat domain-containing protein [Chloroflexota bacterium]